MILKYVKQTILRHHLFESGQHVLVCVSGGADSMALCVVLNDLAPKLGIKLIIAHFNHRIRGRAADEDAKFVEEAARRLGIDFVMGSRDVPALARNSRQSLEMAGREARYSFFAKAAHTQQCDVAATAHTADDQAETVLMKLTRGAGPQGLRGIPYITYWKDLKIVRPFRDIDHESIVRFLERRHLEWREDASNENTAFLRNRVRHEVLPFLESKLNPRVRQSLARLANIMEEEDEWLDSLTMKIFSECSVYEKSMRKTASMKTQPQKALLCEPLVGYPLAAQRRVLRYWLMSCGLTHELLDFGATDRLIGLLTSQRTGQTATLQGGWIVRRQYDRMIIKKGAGESAGVFNVRLNIPGETLIPEYGFHVASMLKPGLFCEKPAGIGIFPARASLSTTAWRRRHIRVRSWRPGDRFCPFGMRGSKKIQDIFVDMKIPKEQRHQVPLFECGDKIIWVPGYQIARGWGVTDTSLRALQLMIDLM